MMHLKWLSLFILMIITSCGGSSELVNDPPFKILEAEKEPLQVDGHKVFFRTSALPRDVAFKSMYFGQRKATVLWDTENTYYADFPLYTSDGEKVLSSNMAEESKNPLPVMPVEVPHAIKENEALLHYSVGEDSFYTIFEVQ
ncbi:hypothetical protein [Leeuwenhoekiella sp. H156]|uniref:hypothetical protein n=1 Tax=Leeuwenhoekiella sp. H156 TaxID=3450128 RepID=UPI003FA464B6